MLKCSLYVIWHTGYEVHTRAVHFILAAVQPQRGTLVGKKETNCLSNLTSGPSGPLSPFLPLKWNLPPGSPFEWTKKDEETHEASPDSYVGLIKYKVTDLRRKSRKETHRLSSATFLSYFSVVTFHTLKVWKNWGSEPISCKDVHSTLPNISHIKLPSALDSQSSILWSDPEGQVGQQDLTFPAGKHLQHRQTNNPKQRLIPLKLVRLQWNVE